MTAALIFCMGTAIMPARMSTPLPPTSPPPPLPRITAPRREQLPPPGASCLTPRARRGLLDLTAWRCCWRVIRMPLLIWVVGNRVLGPYTHGQNLHAGPLALLRTSCVGLLHGSAVFWAVALGRRARAAAAAAADRWRPHAWPSPTGGVTETARWPGRCQRRSLRPVKPHGEREHRQRGRVGRQAPAPLALLAIEAGGRGRREQR